MELLRGVLRPIDQNALAVLSNAGANINPFIGEANLTARKLRRRAFNDICKRYLVGRRERSSHTVRFWHHIEVARLAASGCVEHETVDVVINVSDDCLEAAFLRDRLKLGAREGLSEFHGERVKFVVHTRTNPF